MKQALKIVGLFY